MSSRKIKKCPSCKTRLSEETIEFSEIANNVYKVKLLNSKELDYELIEVEYVFDTCFRCRRCGKNLHLNEDDVVKILKAPK